MFHVEHFSPIGVGMNELRLIPDKMDACEVLRESPYLITIGLLIRAWLVRNRTEAFRKSKCPSTCFHDSLAICRCAAQGDEPFLRSLRLTIRDLVIFGNVLTPGVMFKSRYQGTWAPGHRGNMTFMFKFHRLRLHEAAFARLRAVACFADLGVGDTLHVLCRRPQMARMGLVFPCIRLSCFIQTVF